MSAPYPTTGYGPGAPPPAPGYNPGYPPSGFNGGNPPPGGFSVSAGGFTLGNASAGAAPVPPNPSYPPPGGSQPGTAGFAPPAAGDTTASAPAIPSIPGFIDSSFTPIIQPPTNPYFIPDGEIPKEREIPQAAAITELEAKTALETYAKNKCCYGKPDGIVIQNINMKSAFQYRLTTFTETRETVWEFEPYTNQSINPPGQPIPGPWDYPMQPSKKFEEETRKIKIPNTANVRPCHTCYGNGRTRCEHCSGLGGSNCVWCHGSGRKDDGACNSCNGMGRNRCTWCTGNGHLDCKMCRGKCHLYMYLELIVTWKPTAGECISDSTIIPKKKLGKASGLRALTEQNQRVFPLTNFPDEEINRASNELITKHGSLAMGGLVLEQKQEVDVIRIAEVEYTWGAERGAYYVYGQECHVYFPNYPKNCCCGCSIL